MRGIRILKAPALAFVIALSGTTLPVGAEENASPVAAQETAKAFNYDDPPFLTMGPGELEMISDQQRKMYFTKFIKGFNDLKLQPPSGLVLSQDQLEDAVSHPDDWEKFMFVVYEKCTKKDQSAKEKKACKNLEEARMHSLRSGESRKADKGG